MKLNDETHSGAPPPDAHSGAPPPDADDFPASAPPDPQRLLRDLQQAPVMLWTAGPDGACGWVNQVWIDYTGRPLECQVRDGWLADVHPEDLERRTGIHQASFASHVPFTLDVRLRSRDGSHRWFYETAVPRYDDAGGYAGYVGSCVDIHERKSLEDALAERARTLRMADRRKDEFIAVLSHELRNPLAPIANAAGILRALGSADPAVVTARNVIERSVEQLGRLVNDLLEVARYTQGRIVLQRAEVPLAEVLELALEGPRSGLQARGHTLHVNLPNPDVRVHVDKVRLAQALTNVVSNASKFSTQPGRIEIDVQLAGGALRIAVKDQGQGIRPDFMPNLFDMFAQQDASLARTQGGLGVGLSIAKRVAQLHGGDLQAHSEGPGRGAEFVFHLPLAAAEAPCPCPPESRPAPGKGCRVLLIEDNSDAREALRVLLELWGNEVATAPDGDAGLRLAESFRPHIVLCDIGLPGTDGFALIAPLRRTLAGQRTVFAALTSYGAAPSKARALQAGFDSFLVKPLQGEAFEGLRRSYAEHAQHAGQ